MIRLTGHGRLVFASERGPVGLAWTQRGVRRLTIGHKDADEAAAALAARHPELPAVARAPQAVAALRRRLQAVLAGRRDELDDVPVDFGQAAPFSIHARKSATTLAGSGSSGGI